MRTPLVFLIIGIFCFSIFIISRIPTIAQTETITVPDDYPTIQAAINAASSRGTIYVRNGTYYENLVVNKSVSLIGEAESSTIIDGNFTGNVVKVTSSKVSISEFTITYSAGYPTSDQNTNGIFLDNISDCNITENNIENNEEGILLSHCFNDSICRNNITANSGAGILLDSSSNNNICRNNIANNWGGICIGGSFNNNIVGNNIVENYGWKVGGVVLEFFSSNNIVSGNDIANNTNGICLTGDVFHRLDWTSSNNKIYHNNLLNNTNQALCGPAANIWDNGYPSGGNHWSDYVGADSYRGPYQNATGSDGIGDTPHVINGNNIDNYPLMKPYVRVHDVAVLSVTASRAWVYQGFLLNINVTTSNLGDFTESFNVTVYADATMIEEFPILSLAPNIVKTTTVSWNTASAQLYHNYTLSAVASLVPHEFNVTNNFLIDGIITVRLLGDVNHDGKVDGRDITIAARAFGTKLGDPKWNAEADINGDGRVDGRDITMIARNFGK